jgi:hypothetical protein
MIVPMTVDISLVLTDWCEEDEHGEMGYGTIHFAREPQGDESMCGRQGLPYEFYSELLSHDDPAICEGCKRIATALVMSILQEEDGLEFLIGLEQEGDADDY